jgi:hypothetical protein
LLRVDCLLEAARYRMSPGLEDLTNRVGPGIEKGTIDE